MAAYARKHLVAVVSAPTNLSNVCTLASSPTRMLPNSNKKIALPGQWMVVNYEILQLLRAFELGLFPGAFRGVREYRYEEALVVVVSPEAWA